MRLLTDGNVGMPGDQPTPSLLDLRRPPPYLTRCVQQEEDPWRVWFGAESIDPGETSYSQPCGPVLDLCVMSTNPPGVVVIDDQAAPRAPQFP